MSTANLDSADLKKVPSGGWINEDLMQQIWDISSIPLPYTDRAGTSGVEQEYSEWNVDKLRDPDLANKKVDGQDLTGNDTNTGNRLGNHCQISTKVVAVSTRADASDTVGGSKTLAYQVMMRQRELKRDVEAIALSNQGSVADDGDTVPGEAGSVFSFIKTNGFHGAGGSTPGFNNTTKLTGDVVAGTARGGTEKMVRDCCQAVYEKGGDPTTMMARPSVIRGFSEYCFTSSARIATLTSETGQKEGAATAKGAVNVFVTDFGVTLDLIPNRLQPVVSAGVSNIGIFDFEYLDLGYLVGYRTEPQAKTGLSEKRQMLVDWTNKVRNEEAQGAIYDITEATAWVSGVV